ncbi:Diacylglycerol O-acyltransferase 2-like protein 6 [Seminavis robusta]|uniref:Acyltransferase n=1 Tax=Seminavis robusta TaxID=568900 RepID=A0A9N8E412_9STRA|nr:Diacylglycerol O-acyltransferase 2-like protein 6 [Seminavis robusta]|eukprot:Sro639_g179820.1 Diacylglycerol O-acyltransferase 2-like protein 6 (392) ;mRNA; r:51244-52419
MAAKKDTPEFYQLDYANLPDELFQSAVPAEKWLDRCVTTTEKSGFPLNSLNKVQPVDWVVEVERIIGISLYMILNVLPFLILPMAILYFGVATPWAQYLVLFVLGYVAVLSFLETMVMQPIFQRRYQQAGYLLSDESDFRNNQYVFTERNTCKYLSASYVWPHSIHPPALAKTPVLFCIVPHGVGPFGITAYPIWSKLWNAKLCHWTTAPVVLNIPIVGYLLRKIGYIPAKAPQILKTLTEQEDNVGVILDGIAGMFQDSSHKKELAYLKKRKGIVKIALKAGVPIIPVYAFGHTAAYSVLVDPFGILEHLSNSLNTSLTPFFGRWGWLLGPPRRVPVTVCLGNPVHCPKTESPTQEQINEYHAKLLEGYQQVFDQHKTAYGWKDKTLEFV